MFYQDILGALEGRGVRYLLVGGVAVVLHGFVRATADLDLFVGLDEENLRSFLSLMRERGYCPKIPVPIEEFAVAENRDRWRREKGMKVFALYHPQRHGELIGVFVHEPVPFEEAYARREMISIGEFSVSVAAERDLIAMKAAAGRPQDLEDIRALRELGRT